VTRHALIVFGGQGRFSARVLPPMITRLREAGCTVVLASAPPCPESLQEVDGLTVVSLRPERWHPSGTPVPTTSGSGRRGPMGRLVGRLDPRSLSAGVDRRVRARQPEYADGRQTWSWVRASGDTMAAAAAADLVVAANAEAVRAVWELGRSHPGPEVVTGMAGVEGVLDAWRRASSEG